MTENLTSLKNAVSVEEGDLQPKKKKMSLQKKKRIIQKTISYFFLVVFSLFFLFPLIVMVCRSFFTTTESLKIGAGLIPRDGWYFKSYAEALDSSFLRYFGNTLIVILANVIGQPLTAAMAAYAFTKVKFKGRKIIFTTAMCTIMLPGILTMIPVYKIFTDIGWIDTLLPITVPAFFGGGFLNIFLIMQFIRGLPKEMDEAAIIDGANVLQLMFRITFPLILPVISLVAVQSFFFVWNDFMGPLMYITDESYLTLPVGIYNKFFTAITPLESVPNVQMATGVLIMLPPAVVFMIFQKQLVEGVTFTGLKT